jgi:hypothetical protein
VKRLAAPLSLLGVAFFLASGPLLTAGCGDDDDEQPTLQDPSARSATANFELIGSWDGRLHQRGLKPFRLLATIRSFGEPELNTVSYTGIDCSGNWAYLGSREGAFRFREVIDRGGGGTCKGAGIVRLIPAGPDRLRYRFRGGGVKSRGVLSRVG